MDHICLQILTLFYENFMRKSVNLQCKSELF